MGWANDEGGTGIGGWVGVGAKLGGERRQGWGRGEGGGEEGGDVRMLMGMGWGWC